MTDDIDAEFAARRKLHWQRDPKRDAFALNGNEWSLRCGRRRMGRVIPDGKLWRRELSRGRSSAAANLSWTKDAAMAAAIRELIWESKSSENAKASAQAAE